MQPPKRKSPGEPVLARDWNTMVNALAARTPRHGSGLRLSQTGGGFAYSFPAWPQARRETPPPFGVLSIRRLPGSDVFSVYVREGWVVERKSAGEGGPVVVFHMPLNGSQPLDAVPRPSLDMTDGDSAWCVFHTDKRGAITGDPQIVVEAGDQDEVHYAPDDPKGPGRNGTYAVRLLKLTVRGRNPVVRPYQQSDIEHWAQLWTGENTGGGAGVLKEHDESSGIYKFRSIVAGDNVKVEEDGDVIRISCTSGYGSGTGGTP